MRRNLQINISLILVFFSIFLFASFAIAQTPQEIINGIQNNIQVTVSPQFPKAGESVSIYLESYSTPLDQANISWIVGGKVIKKGFGLTNFTTTVGRIGSKTTITARLLTANGSTVDKTITIQPADIDLLWQATSYVPPFYQGKALYPHQGLITFTAVPNISTTKNVAKTISSYIYTWNKDGDVLGDFSGYGKSTFSLRGTIISRPFTMTVNVTSVDGVSIGSASITINPLVPKVVFYENNPSLGILFNKQLSSYTMPEKELSITAVPYYFNTGTEPTKLEYKWKMNGQNITSQGDPATLTVRNSTGVKGSASVSLQISNALKTLQFASNSVAIIFGQTNQTSL